MNNAITGCILAGGKGERMGGVDKGLMLWQGKPLIETVITRFSAQVDTLLISANRNLERYGGYGVSVLSDHRPEYAGPLAGIEQALHAAPHSLVAIVPCDAPNLPLDLVVRLREALFSHQADIAIATTPDGDQPVFCLIKKSLHASLVTFLNQGGHKIQDWTAQCALVRVSFDDASECFVNLNTPLSLATCVDDYDPNSLPVADARRLIAQFLQPIRETVPVPLRDSLNRILAEDILAPQDVPGYDNSAMDGYAIRFSDIHSKTETALTVAGTALAGTPYPHELKPNEAIRIMTGAPIPIGADTVVMQEEVRCEDTQVWIAPTLRAGQNVRARGEDLKRGSAALTRGTIVGPAELGLMASLGLTETRVYRPLRVAFFSTGDELVEPGHTLNEGQIYNSNSYTLYGMLTALGVDCVDYGIVKDDPAALESAFRTAASQADVIISSGGVSVGEADFVKHLLNQLGEVLFWKIAMKPGRPLAYGKIGSSHFFGLPGNPVAVMVTFYEFVREALLTLSGASPCPSTPMVRLRCTTALKKPPGRVEFQRGVASADATGEWTVRSTGAQGSGILRSMCEANCFIVLPQDSAGMLAREWVDVHLFKGITGS